MSRSTDKLVDVYFSPEATALKQKSWAAGKIAIVSAVAFLVGFGICISLIFTSILGINPVPGFATVLLIAMFGVVTLVAIPTCWVFTIRGIYFRFKVQSLVSERMSIGEA